MKRIIFIFAAILVATSMAFAQKKAVISVEESAFDFGVIKEANGKVSHTFTVENTGDMPLVTPHVVARRPNGPSNPFPQRRKRKSRSLSIRRDALASLSRPSPSTVTGRPEAMSWPSGEK